MFDEEPDRDPHGECRAEIARLTGELAAARAVPAEVEVAIGLVDAIVEHVRTLDSYDWQSRLDDSRPSDDAKDDARELSHALRDYDRSNGSAFLRAAIARAIAEARQPSTVGGLLATARCSCTHEAGDSRCDAHPSCSECGAASARPVDGCEACRGTLPKGG